MKFIKSLAVLSTLLLSSGASANLIVSNGYELNTDTNVITGSGYEWLRWEETFNQSLEQVLDTYSLDGWSLATNAQMAALLTDFFPEYNWSSEEEAYQSYKTVYDGLNNEQEFGADNDFIALFGDSDAYNGWVIGAEEDYRGGISAYYGSDDDDDGKLRVVTIYDDYYSSYSGATHGEVRSYEYPTVTTHSGIAAGFALVRAQPVDNSDTVSVSEPSAIALFGFCLITLLVRRNRKAEIFKA